MPAKRASSDSSRSASGAPGSTPAEKPRRLVVIDGANAVFRAFFGVPALRAPDGTPTNATFGFTNMLLKVLRQESPDLVAVAFDPRGGSFRKQVYPEYKSGRDATPEDLLAQIPLVKEVIGAFSIPVLEIENFEADDVIATLAAECGEDTQVSIISTDKDLMQLVSERVTLVDGIKDRRFGPAEVEERFGVPPEQILDLRALVGDSSDNIPGVKGIGEKGAAKLIREWGTLEELLAHREEVSAKRARNALEEHEAEARLSKELSTLRDDVELGIALEDLERREPDTARLRDLYKRLGFTRLLESLDAGEGAAEGTAAAASQGAERSVEVVADAAAFEAALASLEACEQIVVLAVAEPGSAVDSRFVGLAFALDECRALFVALEGGSVSQQGLPGLGGEARASGVSADAVVEGLRPWLAEGAPQPKAWWSDQSKRFHSWMGEQGVELAPARFDLEVASFLLDSSGSHQVAALAQQTLGRELQSWEELAGRGAKAVPASELARDELARWAGAQVCAVAELAPRFVADLERDDLATLFDEVEMPLTAVLSRMERAGVRIDEDLLASLSAEYEKELARIEAAIYASAGEEFLVSSPKQLQVILFEKLKLPPLKKTKTGYSTAESVLEQLTEHHELPRLILAWRRLSKLKSTYIDALPKLVNAQTGRIHPHFNQTGAATGRLSASDPNVQNIPIRTEEGVRIREAFIPAEGCVLLSADYSQVELRILAHYSGDESLIDAFERGEDIHRRTAAEVAGIAVEDVSDDQRARAKAVNFGIIYGSSAFGLANQLGIAAADAQATIDAYFARYEGVQRFLEETTKNAKKVGHVTTLMGRRRYLPDLRSRNRTLRQAAERMAVNTVIQGTAADLIKKAMVEVDQALAASALAARMLLQVHDELVFEAPESEVDAVEAAARECMEGVFSLRVPLVVDVGRGANWRQAH